MSVFAEQLKKYRTEQTLSQDDLAARLFISRQAISKWENGDATPDLPNLIKLADIFGISLDMLVLGHTAHTTVTETPSTKPMYPHMNGWDFLARYWWIFFGIAWLIYMFTKR